MKGFLTGEKWWRHRIIAVGVVVLLLYGLLVVITGATGDFCFDCPDCGYDCEDWPLWIAFGWPWALLTFGSVAELSPGLLIHIANATFYFLTTVFVFTLGRRYYREGGVRSAALFYLRCLCILLSAIVLSTILKIGQSLLSTRSHMG